MDPDATPPAAQGPRTEMPNEPSSSRASSVLPQPTSELRETASPDEPAWGMSQGDRRVVFVMACVVFALMVVNWVRIVAWQPAPLQVDRPAGDEYRFVIDVNSATWVEWMQLDGIGETLARRIVVYRETYGPFQTIDEIDEIPGVGPKTFAKIRDQLVCQAPPQERRTGTTE